MASSLRVRPHSRRRGRSPQASGYRFAAAAADAKQGKAEHSPGVGHGSAVFRLAAAPGRQGRRPPPPPPPRRGPVGWLAGLPVELWRTFSGLGLVIGALFFAAALTPSLIPRSPLLQGVLSGVCFAIGYGLGVLLLAAWE